MAKADEFGKPDREGFQALFAEPFEEYRGVLFCRSGFDPVRANHRLKTRTPEEVQREFNHTHLFFYAADIQVQRQWARELEKVWSFRFAKELPSAQVKLHQEDNGQEVIVTLWKMGDAIDVPDGRSA